MALANDLFAALAGAGAKQIDSLPKVSLLQTGKDSGEFQALMDRAARRIARTQQDNKAPEVQDKPAPPAPERPKTGHPAGSANSSAAPAHQSSTQRVEGKPDEPVDHKSDSEPAGTIAKSGNGRDEAVESTIREVEKALVRAVKAVEAGDDAELEAAIQPLALLMNLLALIEEADSSTVVTEEGQNGEAATAALQLTAGLDKDTLEALIAFLSQTGEDKSEAVRLALNVQSAEGPGLTVPLSEAKATLETLEGTVEASLADAEALKALAERAVEAREGPKLVLTVSKESAQSVRPAVDAPLESDASPKDFPGIQLEATLPDAETNGELELKTQTAGDGRPAETASNVEAPAPKAHLALKKAIETLSASAAQDSAPTPRLNSNAEKGEQTAATPATSSKESGNLVNRLLIALGAGTLDVETKPVAQVATPGRETAESPGELLQRLDVEALIQRIAKATDEDQAVELAKRLERILSIRTNAIAAHQKTVLATAAVEDLFAGDDALPDLESSIQGERSRIADGHGESRRKEALSLNPNAADKPAQAQTGNFAGPGPAFDLKGGVRGAEPANSQPSLPNLREAVVQQTAERIAVSFQNGNEGEIRMTLKPESLGNLRIRITIEQDVMVAKFVVENQAVKGILENGFGQLKDALEKQGILIGGFHVSTGNEGGAQTNEQDTPYAEALGIPDDPEDEGDAEGAIHADRLPKGEGSYRANRAIGAYRHVNYLA